jgi:hypothetical protein
MKKLTLIPLLLLSVSIFGQWPTGNIGTRPALIGRYNPDSVAKCDSLFVKVYSGSRFRYYDLFELIPYIKEKDTIYIIQKDTIETVRVDTVTIISPYPVYIYKDTCLNEPDPEPEPTEMTGFKKIIDCDFSNTSLAFYQAGSWNFTFSGSDWDSPYLSSTGGQTLIPNSLDYTQYVNGWIENEMLRYEVYNDNDSPNSTNRMQSHHYLNRTTDSLYVKMDVYFPSDVKTSFERAGTSGWFCFAEDRNNHVRFRINYVGDRLVYRVQNAPAGYDWYAPEPVTGWVDVVWDDWSTIEMMVVTRSGDYGDVTLWVTNNGVKQVACEVKNYRIEHGIGTALQFLKLYTSDAIMDAPGVDCWLLFDNYEMWIGNED